MPVALPTPLTRLIGREPEVQALQSTLRHDDVRLVTLTGAGGTGKTRLAIAVAAELRDAFPDGIFFVDLAPLTEPDLVLPTIASTLGVRETESKSLRAALGVFLATKRLLLVCDNFEHLLAAATVVSDLLKAAPGVKALVTSRNRWGSMESGRWLLPRLRCPRHNRTSGLLISSACPRSHSSCSEPRQRKPTSCSRSRTQWQSGRSCADSTVYRSRSSWPQPGSSSSP